MNGLGSPNRGNDPLNVLAMAAALVVAAIAGAGIGFVLDLFGGEEAVQTDEPPAD